MKKQLLIPAILLAASAAVGLSPDVAARVQDPVTPAPAPQGPPPGGPGRGGRGGVPPEVKLVDKFDKNADKRLDTEERKVAREWIAANPIGRGGPGGPGGGPGRVGGPPAPGGPPGRGGAPGGRGIQPGTPGRALKPADVRTYKTEPFYDPDVLRTVFLQFENSDWEQELAAFNNTDVEVPATAIVDGVSYKDVGVHFRGASSFFMTPAGNKRSLNLAFDFVHDGQNVGGYRTLNLLNATSDPTFVRAALYSEIARAYLPAPKVNYMRVVINGESWGIYVNAQQYNKDFLRDFYKTDKGARFKVPGSPGGRGGMEYLGEDVAAYKPIYEIKTKDDPKVWADLIAMFKVLNETPPDKLEAALAPKLNIDGALRFLAIEMALANTDGYWTRASDYSIYQNEKGQFQIVPHDMNEAMMAEGGGGRGGPGGPPPGGFPGGPPPDGRAGGPPPAGPPPAGGQQQDVLRPAPGGGRGGPNMRGPELDPLIGLDDATKPLRSKLLAVPALRTKYLGYVREIAEKWLDWNKLGPLAAKYQSVIAEDVKLDTRKLYSTEAFETGLTGENSLKTFVDKRREYLLKVIAK